METWTGCLDFDTKLQKATRVLYCPSQYHLTKSIKPISDLHGSEQDDYWHGFQTLKQFILENPTDHLFHVSGVDPNFK